MDFSRLLRRLRSLKQRRSYGLDKLDIKLAKYVNKTKGFFVEAGANDGVAQSNTLYFEKYRGWTGLLVEPIPELASKCRKNRPFCLVENVALVSFDYPEQYINLLYGDLMSVVKGSMESPDKEYQHAVKGSAYKGQETYEISIPTKTLSALLQEYSINQVDLLVLDVEGYEKNVLRGLDLNLHRPEYILVEVRDRLAIDAILLGHYKCLAELSALPTYQDILYKLK